MDLQGKDFYPIDLGYNNYPLSFTIDFAGHSIKNMGRNRWMTRNGSYTYEDNSNLGLFRRLSLDADKTVTIKNLNFYGLCISNPNYDAYIGAVFPYVQYGNFVIENVNVIDGVIGSVHESGFLVGCCYGYNRLPAHVTIKNCSVKGNAHSLYSYGKIGGLIGYSSTVSCEVCDSTFEGNIISSGDAGGIITRCYGSLKVHNCHVRANLYSNPYNLAGGLCANFSGEFMQISNCSFEGSANISVSGHNSGIVGNTDIYSSSGAVYPTDEPSYIKNCYVNANISGGNAGGIISYCYCSPKYSYETQEYYPYKLDVSNVIFAGSVHNTNNYNFGFIGTSTSGCSFKSTVSVVEEFSADGAFYLGTISGYANDSDDLGDNYSTEPPFIKEDYYPSMNAVQITDEWKSAAWWRPIGFSDTIWNIANNRLPTLKGATNA
jgi:hypothetical protein